MSTRFMVGTVQIIKKRRHLNRKRIFGLWSAWRQNGLRASRVQLIGGRFDFYPG